MLGALELADSASRARNTAVSELPSYTLIQTAKLNDVEPQPGLADVRGRINDQTVHNLDQLLPWNWRTQPARLTAW